MGRVLAESRRRSDELVFARDGLTASILVARQPDLDNTYLAVNGKVRRLLA